MGERELAGHVAVVTGSSSGIGRAIALRLAELGAAVIAHGSRASEALEGVAREIAQRQETCVAFDCDFLDEANLPSFVERCWEWRGGIDIWVNNAGADVLTGTAADLALEAKLELLWRVDVKAALLLSRAVGGLMLQAQSPVDRPAVLGRSIVMIGWDQASQGMEGDSGLMFGTIKSAVEGMTRSLAQSLAPRVRVNCVAPGWIRTKWGQQSASEQWQARAQSESLAGRWGEPDDVARAVACLVGDGGQFISGQCIPVNGGFRFGSR